MKLSEVEVGGRYRAKVSQRLVVDGETCDNDNCSAANRIAHFRHVGLERPHGSQLNAGGS